MRSRSSRNERFVNELPVIFKGVVDSFKDLLREKHNDDRDGGSGRHRHGRARSHSFDASPAPVRRFTEGAAKGAVSSSRTHE